MFFFFFQMCLIFFFAFGINMMFLPCEIHFYHQRTSSQGVLDANDWNQFEGKELIVFEIDMMFFQTNVFNLTSQNCDAHSALNNVYHK